QWQVLNKAKTYIQDLEQTLDTLLKLKESFNLVDGYARSLEEVRKEYARMYSGKLTYSQLQEPGTVLFSPPQPQTLCQGSPAMQKGSLSYQPLMASESGEILRKAFPTQREPNKACQKGKNMELTHSPGALSPDLMEFERYLTFYKQMMDLLTGNGIISSQEVTLSIVSAAISHLWQNLSEERKASLLQAWTQKHSGLPGLRGACQELACAEGSVKDSGVESQGASCSLVSTPEEILFEDAIDVAGFLDKSEAPSTSSSSSVLASCNPENSEKYQLYMQILEFFKSLCCVNVQLKQDPALAIDDELLMLRCTETFDDE
uniref:Stimulated by retinoic acid 8 n=1 Tax=Loxodonta africana TaxID=9785 RepID=G3UDQ2_LOXAF